MGGAGGSLRTGGQPHMGLAVGDQFPAEALKAFGVTGKKAVVFFYGSMKIVVDDGARRTLSARRAWSWACTTTSLARRPTSRRRSRHSSPCQRPRAASSSPTSPPSSPSRCKNVSIVPDAQLAWQAAVLLCRREISRLCRAYRCTCMIVLSRESARANLFVTCVKHSVFSLSDIADPAKTVWVLS